MVTLRDQSATLMCHSSLPVRSQQCYQRIAPAESRAPDCRRRGWWRCPPPVRRTVQSVSRGRHLGACFDPFVDQQDACSHQCEIRRTSSPLSAPV